MKEGLKHTTSTGSDLLQHARLPKWLIWVCWLVVAGVGGKLLLDHYHLITCEMPLEYREAHIPCTTHMLLEGKNPFDLALQPNFTNVYGITFSYICYPVAYVLGETYAVYRLVAAVFIWLCCFVMVRIFRNEGVLWLFSVMGGVIMYASLLYFVTPMVRPDSFGLFLYLLAIYIPYRKRWSVLSMCVSAILVVVAFLAKTYFLLGAPFIGSYIFLFHSKRKGLIYTGIFLSILIPAVLWVNYQYETFFSNVFFVYTNYKIDDVAYLWLQCGEYLKHSGGLVAISLVAGYLSIRNTRLKDITQQIDVAHGSKPLLMFQMGLPHYIALWVVALFLYRMGQHKGAWLTYLLQLLTPVLLWLALKEFRRLPFAWATWGLLLALGVNIYTASFPYLRNARDVEAGLPEWHMLQSLVASENLVLNTPLIAFERLKAGKKVYDTGNSEYFEHGGERQGLWSLISDPKPEIRERWNQFLSGVQDSVTHRVFDLVALDRGPRFLMDENRLQQSYSLLVTIPIVMPHATMHTAAQRFDVGIWEPKGKERSIQDKYLIYKQLYESDPNNFFVNYYLGFQCLEILHDYKNAVFFMENAVLINPDVPILHSALGAIYFNQFKNYSQALPHFQRAYQLLPNDPSAKANLGYTYRMLGNEDMARQFLGDH
ncbi:MAG: hypothetical protein H6585_06440 [Flavobacteriales bacterium]|nr:hypothetical protein [Flavobacteriales bacterium]MCB9447967.1 hypothetical protein [Flavobacteriales bacterium]